MKCSIHLTCALCLWPLVSSAQGYTVQAWGDNSYGQTHIPLYLTNAIAVAGGAQHSLAARIDGSVLCWGGNSEGQCDAPPDATNVIAVAAGYYHSLALRADGTVVGWGDNSQGQISPPPTATNLTAIAAGPYCSLALRADGTAVAWGQNQYGQTNIPAQLENVTRIDSGYHGLALTSDGTVTGWGFGFWGQTNGALAGSNVIAIATGVNHSLALKTNGTVVAWGRNLEGQTNVPAGLSNVVSLAAGLEQSLALKTDGTVTGWGRNQNSEAVPPASLANEISVAIAAGTLHSLALTRPVVSDLQSSTRIPRLELLATNGSNYQLEHLDELPPTNDWSLTDAGTITAQPQFYYDGSAAGLPHRFYRLSSSDAALALAIEAVPRVTLVAPVGLDYDIEFRKAIGPSNSWAVLTEVQITNVPQYHYDEDGIDQPARLYRLVPHPMP